MGTRRSWRSCTHRTDGQIAQPDFAGLGSFVFDVVGNVYSISGQKIQKFDVGGNLMNGWSLPNYPAEREDGAPAITVGE